MNSLEELASFLLKNDDYVLAGHENPDPDSLGAMLGLCLGLRKLGKKCRLVSADPVPPKLSWPGLELVEYFGHDFHPGDSCVIVLDCEVERTGKIAPGLAKAPCLINIDHHERKRGRGDLVYVNPKEAATSIIVYRLLQRLRIPLDQAIATALYAGIVGDTGGFRHANTNAEVLEIAAQLLRHGVFPDQVAREIYGALPFNFMRFLGYALTNLQLSAAGRLAWLAVSFADFERFSVKPQDSDQLISYARMVETAEIALVLRETEPRRIRLGWRSKEVDVASLARYFGGGGHKLAAGATLAGDLDVMAAQAVSSTEKYLVTGEIDERDS